MGIRHSKLNTLRGVPFDETSTKLYNAYILHDEKVQLHVHDTKEILDDAEEIRLKLKEKQIRVIYAKINKLYDTFVPQMELSLEQRYFLDASTSNVTPKTESPQKSSSPPKEMPKISRMLNLFVNLNDEIKRLEKLIDEKLVIDTTMHFAYNNNGDN
ncbi:hypothetical protein Tco_1294427 [Tanacetum coccineum]